MSNDNKSSDAVAGCGGCLMGVVVIAFFVWAFNSCNSSGSTSHSEPAPVAFVDGATAQIGKGAAGLPCFATKDDLNAFIDAETKHDSYGAGQALTGAINLSRGEDVRAISHAGFLWSIIQIRVESGDDAGNACWMPADTAGAFVNIHNPE
jgi:hypothetical protein